MAETNVQLVISAKDEASKTLNKVRGELQGLADSPGFGLIAKGAKAAAVGVAALGTAIITAGVFAVKSAADYEQQRIAFETLLGSAEKAKTLLKQVADFADKTPFELPDVVEGSKRLLAFGVTLEDIIPTFKILGDISLGNEQKMDSLVRMFGKVKAKGTADLEALNIAMDAGVPVISSLAKHFNVTQESIFEMVTNGQIGFKDFQATLEEMTSETGMFFNGMDRQSNSFMGTIFNIKDTIGKTAREIIGINEQGDIKEGGVFYRLKQGAEKLLAWLDSHREEIIAYVQKIIDKVIEFAKQAIEWFEKNQDSIKTVLEVFKQFGEIVIAVLVAVAKGIDTYQKGLEEGFLAVFEIIDNAKRKWQDFKDGVSNIWNGIGDTIKDKISAPIDWITDKVKSAIDFVNKLIASYNKVAEKTKLPTIPEIRYALGGAVMAGRPIIVGENRPEVFVPSQSGNIKQLDQVGGKTVTVNFNNVSVRSDNDLQSIIDAVKATLSREEKFSRMGLTT